MRLQAVFLVGVAVGGAAILGASEPLSYTKDVEPVFVAACGDCHGAKRPKKGLVLTEQGREHMLGVPSKMEPGRVLLVAGDPEGSYLWAKLAHQHKEGQGMPRTIFSAKKLPAEQLDLIRRWIEEGANP